MSSILKIYLNCIKLLEFFCKRYNANYSLYNFIPYLVVARCGQAICIRQNLSL